MKKAVFAFLAVLAGCSNSADLSAPALGNSGARIVRDDFAFQAGTLIMESFPVQLRTVVRAKNETSRPVDLVFPNGCKVLVRVYRDAARASLAYDMARVMGCTMAIEQVHVGGGETKEFNAPTISAATILGDSLPKGTYYFSAVLHANGNRIELDAGSAPLAK